MVAQFEPREAQPLASLQPIAESARGYLKDARSENTRKTYASIWRSFETWCSTHGVCSLPAEVGTVLLYLTSRADEGYKVATLQLALTAISHAHKAGGYESPTRARGIRETMQGIKRRHGSAQKQAAPLLVEDLRRVLDALPSGLKGIRDRAVVLLGWSGALRRSEVSGLDVSDVAFDDRGEAVITVRRSKTDQVGAGRRIGIVRSANPSVCPVVALKDWLEVSGITSGPLFQSVTRGGNLREGSRRLKPAAIGEIIKKATARAGLDAGAFSSHSMRAGFISAAARAGKPSHAIQRVSGHRSLTMLHRYIRGAEVLGEDHAGRGLL